MLSRLLAFAGIVLWGCVCGTFLLADPPAGKIVPVRADQAAPKILLRYKFVPGQEIRYEVATGMEFTTQVGSVADTAWNKSDARRHYRVSSADSQAGTASLELTIDRVRMSAQSSSTSAVEDFDSEDAAKQPLKYKHILDRIGKPQATLDVTITGQSVKVIPNADAPVTANKPVAVGGDAAPESYLATLPEQPVGLGEEWKERFETTALNAQRLTLHITMLRVYKLASVKDGKATIEFRTTILTPVHDPSISAQLIQRETSGAFVFDIEQGIIIARQAKADRTVVDAFGPKSSLRCVGKYQERLIPVGVVAQEPRDSRTN